MSHSALIFINFSSGYVKPFNSHGQARMNSDVETNLYLI